MPAVSSFALGGSVVMRRWLLFVLLVIPFVVMLALVVEADDPSSEEGAPRNICLDPDTGDFLCPPTATPTPVPTLDPETCISHPQYCLTPAPPHAATATAARRGYTHANFNTEARRPA